MESVSEGFAEYYENKLLLDWLVYLKKRKKNDFKLRIIERGKVTAFNNTI